MGIAGENLALGQYAGNHRLNGYRHLYWQTI